MKKEVNPPKTIWKEKGGGKCAETEALRVKAKQEIRKRDR